MLWMVPTEDFQRDKYGRRELRHHVLRESRDPVRAWENWMTRDAGIAGEVTRQTQSRDLIATTVDGSRTLDDHFHDILAHFLVESH